MLKTKEFFNRRKTIIVITVEPVKEKIQDIVVIAGIYHNFWEFN
jgi:hypothetical protein